MMKKQKLANAIKVLKSELSSPEAKSAIKVLETEVAALKVEEKTQSSDSFKIEPSIKAKSHSLSVRSIAPEALHMGWSMRDGHVHDM